MKARSSGRGLRLRIDEAPRDELVRRLEHAGVQMNDHARTLLAHEVFASAEPQELDVVLRSVGELAGPAGATVPDLLRVADAAGLAPCPPTAGPWLRLAMLDQQQAPDSVLSAGRPPTAAIHVASEPLWDDQMPRGFYLRVVDGVRWLRGYRCSDDYVQPPDSVFAFAGRGGPAARDAPER